MSDREIIIANLSEAESRIRTNRLIGRVASALAALVGVAIFVTVLSFFVPLGRTVVGSFWIVWVIALVAYIFKSLDRRTTLSETAADVDRQASLKDEVVSAYWFLSQNVSNPWVDLQVRRAATTARKLDVRTLYPRIFPPASYVAAVGVVLLVALNLAPIEPGGSDLFSSPPPDVTDPAEAEELFNQIEELLEQAQALNPSETIEEFQDLLESIEGSDIQLEEAEQEMENIQGLIDEGNLTVASILEGLEEVGEDLEQSGDTEAAGENLIESDLDAAASELEELAGELGTGREPQSDLADVLEEAASNRRPGLEELSNQLEAAAEGLENQDTDAVEEALMGSAESLDRLADIIASQQLQNEAAARMDALQDALRQEQAEATPSDLGDDFTTPGEEETEMPLSTGQGTPQPAQGDSAGGEPSSQDLSGAESEAGAGAQGGEQSGEAPQGNPANINADASGLIPMGFGYSPAIKEGAPTSLEVQLQEEIVEAQMDEITRNDAEEDTQELATRQEESTLDYRDVASDLTPAQQELLNQDRIPREYQNLIKEYFEAIRIQP